MRRPAIQPANCQHVPLAGRLNGHKFCRPAAHTAGHIAGLLDGWLRVSGVCWMADHVAVCRCGKLAEPWYGKLFGRPEVWRWRWMKMQCLKGQTSALSRAKGGWRAGRQPSKRDSPGLLENVQRRNSKDLAFRPGPRNSESPSCLSRIEGGAGCSTFNPRDKPPIDADRVTLQPDISSTSCHSRSIFAGPRGGGLIGSLEPIVYAVVF